MFGLCDRVCGVPTPPFIARSEVTRLRYISLPLPRRRLETFKLHKFNKRQELLVCATSISENGTWVKQHPRLPQLRPLDGSYEDQHTYSSLANWLIPGSLMIGRYPHVEPSRCRTHDKGDEQIQELLEKAGIRTFVSLQAETPPQEEMKVGGVRGFIPYAPTAKIFIHTLTGPPSMEEMMGLRNEHLNKFLPPKRRKASGPAEAGMGTNGSANGAAALQALQAPKISFMHSPIVDLGIPSVEQMEELAADLQRRLEGGEVLYVHCWGGRGRAGTVGACLLVKAYGLSAQEALTRVQRAFDTRQDEGRRSPETEEQKRFVMAFEEHVRRA
eukprot:jgi/Botrbrau1/22040/Bobra.0024s0052.1